MKERKRQEVVYSELPFVESFQIDLGFFLFFLNKKVGKVSGKCGSVLIVQVFLDNAKSIKERWKQASQIDKTEHE